MHVRLARPEDVDSLYELNELFNGPGLTTREHILDSVRNNDREVVFVACLDGNVVGFSCVQVCRSMCYSAAYGEISELFVKEEYRRRGVARALLSFAEEYLRARNVADCRVLTGDKNQAAQALYESLGYERTREVMYRKNLQEAKAEALSDSPGSSSQSLRLRKALAKPGRYQTRVIGCVSRAEIYGDKSQA